MKCEAKFLGVRFATPQVTLGANGRGPAPAGHATVLFEWELRVPNTPRSAWQVYYRFATSDGGEEMGLVQSEVCGGPCGNRTVRLLLPSPAHRYEYRVVWDTPEDGATGMPWQALPSRHV